MRLSRNCITKNTIISSEQLSKWMDIEMYSAKTQLRPWNARKRFINDVWIKIYHVCYINFNAHHQMLNSTHEVIQKHDALSTWASNRISERILFTFTTYTYIYYLKLININDDIINIATGYQILQINTLIQCDIYTQVFCQLYFTTSSTVT